MRWLRNRNLALLIALALGLLLGPGAARVTELLILPALALLIALSASAVSWRLLRETRRLLLGTGLAVLGSYGLNAAAMLIPASLLVRSPELYTGFVLIAAAPPAAAAFGACIVLMGDLTLSLIGLSSAYLLAPIITPLIALAFAGAALAHPLQLAMLLLQLVIAPLIISRLLCWRRLRPLLRPWREFAGIWTYPLVLFTAVGLNRDVFFRQLGLVALLGLTAALGTFGFGALLGFALRRLRVPYGTQISLLLFSTLKNTGFATALALALVSMQASLPGAVTTVVNALYLIWLGLRLEHNRSCPLR